MKRILIVFCTLLCAAVLSFAGPREVQSFDSSWKFAFGSASSADADFGSGTEYFNYWTKAASIHNEGPYSPKFDPAKWDREWKEVRLPHDWVVELPFDAKASHSHGYKTVGPGFPETSVGWYRKEFDIPASYEGSAISLRFDGIFHSSQLWVNGFYLGREDDGYVSSEYDITQYLNYGGSNVVAVRVDAKEESGWFYEGAGIYRHAWLIRKNQVHFPADGVFIHSDVDALGTAHVNVEAEFFNASASAKRGVELECVLIDAAGNEVAKRRVALNNILLPQDSGMARVTVDLPSAHLWNVDDPYLYTARVSLSCDGRVSDCLDIRTGIRTVLFHPDEGFLLNGKRVQIKGVNLHQDHAGVGSAISDELYEYRLERLRSFGCNAIRSSHNPMAPALLDLCDSLGFLVIDENRLMGVNAYHREHLERMIRRDRNHPCVVLWSIGNEEWGIEWNVFGSRLSSVMKEFCHRADPTRQMMVATSSGPVVLEPVDVAGYNYIIQNDVEGQRDKFPLRAAVGSEETTGCGTRGWYFEDPSGAHMPAINRGKQGPDSLYNCIERGWQFYHQRPWLGGLFYWTGFDYRGESNPLLFPATGSSFGLLDYCGFYKDEAYYLKAWWTSEPVLHLLPHWNLAGHEGEKISVWAYSNCDMVQLFVNGRNMGRKKMPADGHLEWLVEYQPGTLKADGFKKGKRVMTTIVRTSGPAARLEMERFVRPSQAVVDMRLLDRKSSFVADGCNGVSVQIEGPAYLQGVGNGDSGWQADEKSSSWNFFNGCAQFILRSDEAALGRGEVKVTINVDGCAPETIIL